jgi:hypothetical protein
MKRLLISTLLIGAFFILSAFKLDNAIVPQEEILSGGPPKDGIEIGGRARAYPIKILNWHEVVNDDISGLPVAVTF